MARVMMHLMTQGSGLSCLFGLWILDPRFATRNERTAPSYLLAWVLSGERLTLFLIPCNIQGRRLKRAVAGKGWGNVAPVRQKESEDECLGYHRRG